MKELFQTFLMPRSLDSHSSNDDQEKEANQRCCREVDRYFLFKHIEELARLHTLCFNSSHIWRESWVDFPTKGREDSLGYLLRLAAFDTRFFIWTDQDGSILNRPGKIIGCGIMERLSAERIEYYGFDKFGGRAGDGYNNVMFSHPESEGLGIASELVNIRLRAMYENRCSPQPKYFVRTRSDHEKLIAMYKRRGFKVSGSQVIEEAGQRSERFILTRPMGEPHIDTTPTINQTFQVDNNIPH